MSSCDELEALHNRLTNMEHIHNLSYVFSTDEIDKRQGVTLADAERRCSKVTGPRSYGTEKDFEQFCDKISAFVEQLSIAPEPDDEFKLTCGVAHVIMYTQQDDNLQNNLFLYRITIRPIAQGHKLFYKILYSILKNKPAQMPFTVESCGPGSQRALKTINTKILHLCEAADDFTDFTFVPDSKNNMTLKNAEKFLLLFEIDESGKSNIQGYSFEFKQQSDEENVFEAECMTLLQTSVELVEKIDDLYQKDYDVVNDHGLIWITGIMLNIEEINSNKRDKLGIFVKKANKYQKSNHIYWKECTEIILGILATLEDLVQTKDRLGKTCLGLVFIFKLLTEYEVDFNIEIFLKKYKKLLKIWLFERP